MKVVVVLQYNSFITICLFKGIAEVWLATWIKPVHVAHDICLSYILILKTEINKVGVFFCLVSII